MPLYRVLQTAPLREVEATMPMEKLFFPRLRQLLDYDYERACLLFEGWRDWLEYADIRDENILKSVEAYLKYRETNVGFLPYSHLTIVVMMLDISPQERQSIDEFRNVAARSYSLTNDYWSWAREVRQSREGKQRMMNALSVVMRKQQVSEEESLEIVKSEAIENEQKVVKLWDSLSAQAGSQDFKQYLDAHIWLCSGNSYWSFTCARYHS
ncbi:hypothetical protein N7507_009645 [Penicillium longicatenatum]|nr:hypothetical protein N7507_009645 [Penicillium longicatenatum]